MPTDITGTDILEEDQATGEKRLPLHPRPDLRATSCSPTRSTAPRPRPRPRCSRPCRSTASPPAARPTTLDRAVLRARHAEPHRAGRHLPAARGAARPLHVHRSGSTTPARRTRRQIVSSTTRRQETGLEQGPHRRGDPRTPAGRPQDPGLRPRRQVRHPASCAPRGPATRRAPEFIKKWLHAAPARAPASTSCSPPRRAPCSTAGCTSPATTCARAALPVLRHRILTNFAADSEGVDTDKIVQKLVEEVEEPGEKDY